jgi:hypothetical protein
MIHAKAVLAASLLALVCAGCGVPSEVVPAAQAQVMSDSTYSTEFSRMHAAIPAGAGSDIQDYQ